MLGSFYTPARYVRLAGDWLAEFGLDHGCAVLDPSCGYGAFFDLAARFPQNRYLGNDIDGDAVAAVVAQFPSVQTFQKNALAGVGRQMYGVGETERLVVVGNPPYNDVTSQINGEVKKRSRVEMDADVRSRDLGLSSLLTYSKLRADYVAVLHPLSYLIKRSNFKACARFFLNYRMLEHLVFSSHEFVGTSRLSAFPVVVALYERAPWHGLSFDDVRSLRFHTEEGAVFSLDGFDYVTDHVDKYPGKGRFKPEVLFYTMRDINALMRSRTFLAERVSNAVDVNPEKLAYYCYIDCFKRYADVPYYLGNFNVPFDEATFGEVSDEVVEDATFNHPEVFGPRTPPSAAAVAKIKGYIARSMRQAAAPSVLTSNLSAKENTR